MQFPQSKIPLELRYFVRHFTDEGILSSFMCWVVSMRNAKSHIQSWSQSWGSVFPFIPINSSVSDFVIHALKHPTTTEPTNLDVAQSISALGFHIAEEIFKLTAIQSFDSTKLTSLKQL